MYPALAVHNALTSQHPNVETLWVGGEGGMEEELVNRAGISYRSIPAAGVHGVGLRALPRNIAKLSRGVKASHRLLREFKPDVLFFTGGFVAVPMAVAGRNIPTVKFIGVNYLNPMDLLKYNNLVFTKASIEKLYAMYL